MSEKVSAVEALIAQWRTLKKYRTGLPSASFLLGHDVYLASDVDRMLAAALPASPPPTVDAAIHQIHAAIQAPVHSEATQDGDHYTHRLAAPTPCTECGYVPGSEVHPSVVTNKPGCPVAAPCAILGCQCAAPPGWQPIATNAKVPFESILGCKDGERRTTHWDDIEGAWMKDRAYRDAKETWQPTHWMPLLQAPLVADCAVFPRSERRTSDGPRDATSLGSSTSDDLAAPTETE